ncbi:MAG: hypothetical protein R3E86_08600 [Pseudomonadales bacterium]
MLTRRLHVVGCHRSGTTLMMELLWYAFEFSGRAAHEVSLFEPIPPGQSLYLSKKPPDTTRIEQAFRSDPELFVIAMLRDPRAVICSRHPNRPDVYFSGFRRWRECALAIERLRGHPRFLLVRYEDLVTAPDQVQDAIAARFAFLRAKARFAQFPEGAEVPENARASLLGVRPFDVSRIDGWRGHLPRVKGQLQAHPDLPGHLVRLGYEADDAWVSDLDRIRAYTQKYKDEAPHPLKRAEAELRYWLKTRRYLRQRSGTASAASETGSS